MKDTNQVRKDAVYSVLRNIDKKVKENREKSKLMRKCVYKKYYNNSKISGKITKTVDFTIPEVFLKAVKDLDFKLASSLILKHGLTSNSFDSLMFSGSRIVTNFKDIEGLSKEEITSLNKFKTFNWKGKKEQNEILDKIKNSKTSKVGKLTGESTDSISNDIRKRLSSLNEYQKEVDEAIKKLPRVLKKHKDGTTYIDVVNLGGMYEDLIMKILSKAAVVENANTSKIQYFPKFDLSVKQDGKVDKYIECKFVKNGNHLGSYALSTINSHISGEKYSSLDDVVSDKKEFLKKCIYLHGSYTGKQYISKNGKFFHFPKDNDISIRKSGSDKVFVSAKINKSSVNISASELINEDYITESKSISFITIKNREGKDYTKSVNKVFSDILSLNKPKTNITQFPKKEKKDLKLVASVDNYLGDFLNEIKDKN